MTSNSTAALAAYADRLERMLNERDEASEAIKDIGVEIKSAGFDFGALRKVVELRRSEKKKAKDVERINLIALYARAIGVQLELALGPDAP